MPRAPRKCPHPGCENRIRGSAQRYCPQHIEHHWQNNKSRGSAQAPWARKVLERAGHRCEIRGPNCTGRATQADHIVPVSAGGKTTLSNGQGACAPCHDDKTRDEALRGLRRRFGSS